MNNYDEINKSGKILDEIHKHYLYDFTFTKSFWKCNICELKLFIHSLKIEFILLY